MNKKTELKTCDLSLVVAMVLILASGIQLEATHSGYVEWVWVHIVVGLIFTGGIVWHLYLHFRWKSWWKRLWRQKSSLTRWMTVFGLLTLLTGIIALFHWMSTFAHGHIGGFHGKSGFIFIVLAIVHTVRRVGFFRR